MKTQKRYYQASIETPLGTMIAISDETALCFLEFFDQKHTQRQIAKMKTTTITDERVAPIDMIEKELALYFAGRLKKFNTPLQLHGTNFQQRVWRQLQKIPFGQTCSYLQMAIAIGMPTACRAAANANGANQLAIIIPCHRVINTNGNLGGYAGGLDRKTWLLQHENNKEI